MFKKPSIQKNILKTLSNRRAISIDSIKKNVSEKILDKDQSTNSTNYAISRSIKNLLSDGLVEEFNSEHKQYLRLTDIGKQRLNNIALECESGLVSTSWDGYWRIVLLDLPEDRKNERDALRYLLKKAEFACLKNSVWISMYPYEHLFNNIKKDLNLSTELIIIVTDNIDEDTKNEFINLCKSNN